MHAASPTEEATARKDGANAVGKREGAVLMIASTPIMRGCFYFSLLRVGSECGQMERDGSEGNRIAFFALLVALSRLTYTTLTRHLMSFVFSIRECAR